jgi:cytochrome c5
MYFATCANGNMASVVINYPSLGAAVNRIGAFLAVAMEYTPAPGASTQCFTNPADATTNSGACYTKFYAFAPDDRTGVFQRVLSANFDRRGQRYLPGACTACHGGTPGFTPGQPYPNAGNIDAAFMPWDAGSMLFADTDPAFPCNVSKLSPACQSVNVSLYSQASQLPQIQSLNALAWRTYQFPEMETAINGDSVDRYAAQRALLTKWYGGDPGAPTAHAFDDSVTPASWLTSGQSAGSATDLYHQVYLHYCRACHTQINGGPEIENLQFQSLAAFLYWDKPIVPGQPAFLQSLVFGQATMPQSRLSTDRFWVDFAGGTSAAQSLAAYLNAQPGVTPVATDSSQNVIGPGAPSIVALNGRTALVSTQSNPNASNTLAAVPGIMLDAVSQSTFVSSAQWSLCSGGPPTTPGGPCQGSAFSLIGTPIIPAGDSAGAAQLGAGLPAFATPASGTYYLTVTAQGFAAGTTTTQTYPLVVP